MARIGSKYLSLSDESLCLDSASVARLQTLMVAKPPKPEHRPPKPIKTTVPAKVSRYARTCAAATARYERAVSDWKEFCNVEVADLTHYVKGESAPTRRLFVALESSKLGVLAADLMTGTLYDHTLFCLSSPNMRISGPGEVITHKEAAKYIESKKPRYVASEDEV